MQLRQRYKAGVAVAISSSLLASGWTSTAAQNTPNDILPQFPWSNLCGPPLATKRWIFSSSGPALWTSGDIAQAESGFNRWERLTGLSGAPLVDMGNISSPNVVTVKRGTERPTGNNSHTADLNGNGVPDEDETTLPDGFKAGDHNKDGHLDHTTDANCTVMHIASPVGLVEHTAAHEVGHSLGMNHTAAKDTRQITGNNLSGFYNLETDGVAPLMNGSCSVPISSLYPNPDDWASLTRRQVPWFTADAGFESDLVRSDIWRGPYSVQTYMPFNGTKYISMTGQAQVGQRVRVEQSPSSTFRVKARFKSTGTTPISFKVFGKRTNFSPPFTTLNPCGAETYIIDQPNGDYTPLFNGTQSDVNGVGSWEFFNGPSFPWPLFSPSEYELELDIFNPDPAQTVYLDNVWVEQ